MHLDTKERVSKLLSVSKVTIVVEVCGEVVAVATFKDWHQTSWVWPFLPCLVTLSVLAPTHLSLDPLLRHSSCHALLSSFVLYVLLHAPDLQYQHDVRRCHRGYQYTWFELILQDVPQMCCWVLYTLYNRPLKVTLLRV